MNQNPMKLKVDCLGYGNKVNPNVMFIGERPGFEEFKQEMPFVGRAGKFLTKYLDKYGISREENYITNIVKSYSEGNIKPTPAEISMYLPLLEKEIEEVNPKIIVMLGRTAADNVPRNPKYKYVHIVHPSAAMRFTNQRLKFEEGMEKLKALLEEV